MLRLLSVTNFEQSIKISGTWKIGEFFGSVRAEEG
jgi:hypothetical protein